MILLISGASHSGKTLLAQKLLKQYHYPYLSIDHLKMGLIRSQNTHLTALSDDHELTAYLWPIVREIIKTAIENKQNLMIEGCYIPFDYQKDFDENYIKEIKYICLVMSENYIRNHFDKIKQHASVIEQRLDDSECTLESVLEDHNYYLDGVKKYQLNYVLIEQDHYVSQLNEIIYSLSFLT